MFTFISCVIGDGWCCQYWISKQFMKILISSTATKRNGRHFFQNDWRLWGVGEQKFSNFIPSPPHIGLSINDIAIFSYPFKMKNTYRVGITERQWISQNCLSIYCYSRVTNGIYECMLYAKGLYATITNELIYRHCQYWKSSK